MRALEAIACLMLLVVLIMLSGCSERIVYRTVSVAVPVYADVPEWMLEDYAGPVPMASADGSVCFADDEIKHLQDWMKWHKVRIEQFKEVVK